MRSASGSILPLRRQDELQYAHFVWKNACTATSTTACAAMMKSIGTGTLTIVIYGRSRDDAAHVIRSLLKLNRDTWRGASYHPQQRFDDILYMTRQGISESLLERHWELDERFNEIFLTEFVNEANDQDKTFDEFLERIAGSNLFDVFQAALLAEWRFQMHGVSNDRLSDVDKNRIREVLGVVHSCATGETRLGLRADWTLLRRVAAGIRRPRLA